MNLLYSNPNNGNHILWWAQNIQSFSVNIAFYHRMHFVLIEMIEHNTYNVLTLCCSIYFITNQTTFDNKVWSNSCMAPTLLFYHTSHLVLSFFTGFIGVPMSQLNASANSFMLDTTPLMRYILGACTLWVASDIAFSFVLFPQWNWNDALNMFCYSWNVCMYNTWAMLR